MIDKMALITIDHFLNSLTERVHGAGNSELGLGTLIQGRGYNTLHGVIADMLAVLVLMKQCLENMEAEGENDG